MIAKASFLLRLQKSLFIIDYRSNTIKLWNKDDMGKEQNSGLFAQRGVLAFLSFFFWLWVSITVIFFFFVESLGWLLTRPFDSRKRVLHYFACWWAWICCFPFRLIGLWRFRFYKQHAAPRSASCIYIANHLSQLDIFLVFSSFRTFKWVSKASVLRIPFVGWGMKLAGYIPLERGSIRSARGMFDRCERELKMGGSVLLFPEGTRSRDGKLKAFKSGPFILAKKTGKPIVPLLIRGTAGALKRGSMQLGGKSTLSLEVLPTIEAEKIQAKSTQELTSETHQYYQELLKDEKSL